MCKLYLPNGIDRARALRLLSARKRMDKAKRVSKHIRFPRFTVDAARALPERPVAE
jgi:hypothetical protein